MIFSKISNKKAEGLSMSVIVIAAIALLVLTVLSVIFLGKMGVFAIKSKDCRQVGGLCDQGPVCDEGYTTHPDAVCFDADKNIDTTNSCCIRVGV